MKPRSIRQLVAISLTLCVSGTLSKAADLYWNPSPLTNNWENVSTSWSATSGGTADTVWAAATNAIFDQAGPYTVTVTDAISAGTVTFAGTGTTTFTRTATSAVTTSGIQINSGTTLDLTVGDALLKSGNTPLIINGTLLNGGAAGGRLSVVSGSGVLKGAIRWATGSNFAGNIVDNGATRIGVNGNGFSSGTITLSGDNSASSGDFLVGSNTIRLASTTALGTGYFRLEGGTAIAELAAGDLSRTSSTAAGGGGINFASTAGVSAINANRTVTLNGGAANGLTWGVTGGFNPTTLVFGNANATHTAKLVNSINLGAVVRTIQAVNGTGTAGGELSGNLTGTAAAGLTKTGTGTLILSGTNTYPGVTTISAGTLRVTGTASLANYGTPALIVITNNVGGTLAVPVGGVGEFDAAGIDTLLTNVTFNTGNSLALDTTNASGGFVYNSNIANTIGITKNGTGTLSLGGNLTYNGVTRINQDSLLLAGTGTLPGNITGAGNLAKSGSGTVTLKGANSYTGTTTVSGGTLIVQRTTQVGLGTGDVSVANGSALLIQDHAGGGQLPYVNGFALAGSGVSGSAALGFYNSGGFSVTGAIAISGGTTVRTDPANQTTSSTVTFTNQISGTGGITFFAQGTGAAGTPRFTLTAANTYAGDTLVTSSGVNTTPLVITLTGGDDRLPSGTALIFGGTPAGSPAGTFNKSATIALDGITQHISALSTANSAAVAGGYKVVGASATGSTLVVTNASASSFAGSIGGAGTNENNIALIKSGLGVLTLSGASTYTGNTTVTAGTLSLDTAYLDDASTLTIAGGATLDLTHADTDVVATLVLNGVTKPAGIYDSSNSGGLITGTGKIQATSGPSDPYLIWIAGFPSLTGPDAFKSADPDKDGLTNLAEYALDANPTSGSDNGRSRSRIETVGAGQALVLTFPVLNGAVFSSLPGPSSTATVGNVTYIIEGSNDLSNFAQGVTEIAPSTSGLAAPDTGWSQRTFRLDGDIGGASPRGPKGFLRVRIVGTP